MNIQTNHWRLPRRTFLRGLGVSLAVPLFEAMAAVPAKAVAGATP